MRWNKLAAAVIILAFIGCVPSLQPLYTEKDIVFEPALLGQWAPADTDETWTFTNIDERAYNLVYADKDGKPGPFDAYLLKLNDKMFLDLFPKSEEMKENDFYKIHLMPVHTFMRVDQIKPTLKLALMNPDWFKNYLKEHPNAIAHSISDDRVILTASTPDLQRFVLAHADDRDAWTEAKELTRKAAPAEKTEKTGK